MYAIPAWKKTVMNHLSLSVPSTYFPTLASLSQLHRLLSWRKCEIGSGIGLQYSSRLNMTALLLILASERGCEGDFSLATCKRTTVIFYYWNYSVSISVAWIFSRGIECSFDWEIRQKLHWSLLSLFHRTIHIAMRETPACSLSIDRSIETEDRE